MSIKTINRKIAIIANALVLDIILILGERNDNSQTKVTKIETALKDYKKTMNQFINPKNGDLNNVH